jgi:TPR repeat protein
MRTALLTTLLCVGSLILPFAHAQQTDVARKQFLDYRAKAEQGDAAAQYNVGICYKRGLGVAADQVEAVKWFLQAAEHGDVLAQSILGGCYFSGQGVQKDYSEAVKWYRKAAEGGEATAFNAVAWILATSYNSAIRDGSNAVFFAEKAVAATGRKTPGVLDTLAAAYAEANYFEKAVSTEQEAIALLQSEGEKNDYRTRLRLFEIHLPYRLKE